MSIVPILNQLKFSWTGLLWILFTIAKNLLENLESYLVSRSLSTFFAENLQLELLEISNRIHELDNFSISQIKSFLVPISMIPFTRKFQENIIVQ